MKDAAPDEFALFAMSELGALTIIWFMERSMAEQMASPLLLHGKTGIQFQLSFNTGVI